MTQKTKQWKQFLIFTILAGFLFGCNIEEEVLSTHNSNQLTYNVSRVKFKEYKENTLLLKNLDKVKDMQSKVRNKSVASKIIYDSHYDFYINTDECKLIESLDGRKLSYTFYIDYSKRSTANVLNNLVLSYNNTSNDYKAYIVTYNLTNEDLTKMSNNQNINLTGKTTIRPLVNYNTQTVLSSKMIMYTDPDTGIVTCWDEVFGSSAATGWEDTVTGYTAVPCPTPSSSSGVGTGGTTGGSYTVYSDNGGGATNTGVTYNQPQPGGTGLGTPPSPVLTSLQPCRDVLCYPETPCDKAKNLLDPTEANLKDKITDLQPCASQVAGECGTSLVKNAAGVYSTNPIAPNPNGLDLEIPDGGNVYGSIHTHPIFDNAIPMFSWGDIHSLYKTYDNSSTHNRKDVTIILVVKTFDDLGNPINTTYALTINNPAQFMAKMDAELAALTGSLEEKKEEKIKS